MHIQIFRYSRCEFLFLSLSFQTYPIYKTKKKTNKLTKTNK